ncbi:MAG: 1-acyl-sn-glycerol-3-phosphate acyltransferase [Treponema sp.]|jgi:1-acyl-sn-glycerol-3-phosphate acyltransferase|nr:1-acyl-sn-glycerol-3-phosphate acyltransferase [Treponema sp.]
MEPYVPQLGIVYPSQPDGHMGDLQLSREIKIDEHYPFLNKSFKFKLIRSLVYLAIFTVVPFLLYLRFALKIEGRKILRTHKQLLKNGAMTASNHIQKWDTLCVLRAIRYRSIYFPVWKDLLGGSDEGFVRFTGGIPIPDDIHTIKFFNRAFDEINARKKWIHVFPESSRFDFFQPIRPFKKGVFTMAWRYHLPVIPMAFSYRKPRFPFTLVNLFRSIIGKRPLPMITLRIGEPLLFDPHLGRKEAVQKIRKECHEAVVRLAGISVNPYPPEGD